MGSGVSRNVNRNNRSGCRRSGRTQRILLQINTLQAVKKHEQELIEPVLIANKLLNLKSSKLAIEELSDGKTVEFLTEKLSLLSIRFGPVSHCNGERTQPKEGRQRYRGEVIIISDKFKRLLASNSSQEQQKRTQVVFFIGRTIFYEVGNFVSGWCSPEVFGRSFGPGPGDKFRQDPGRWLEKYVFGGVTHILAIKTKDQADNILNHLQHLAGVCVIAFGEVFKIEAEAIERFIQMKHPTWPIPHLSYCVKTEEVVLLKGDLSPLDSHLNVSKCLEPQFH